MTFLTAVVLFNRLDYLNHFIKDADWLIVVFYESIEHANYTFIHFENKIVLKIGELIKRILYYKTNRDIECFSPFFEYCKVLYNRIEHSQGFELVK